jgi:hypothetical protein
MDAPHSSTLIEALSAVRDPRKARQAVFLDLAAHLGE